MNGSMEKVNESAQLQKQIVVSNPSAQKDVTSPAKKQFEEKNLRMRQIRRYQQELEQLIPNMKSKLHQPKYSKFSSPLNCDLQEKRFEEFKIRSKKTLYCIDRDIRNMMKKSTNLPEWEKKDLRVVGTVSRDLICMIKGLLRFPDQIRKDDFANESLQSAMRLLTILSKANNFEEEKCQDESVRSEASDAIFMNSSDFDSSFRKQLEPQNMKRRLEFLTKSSQPQKDNMQECESVSNDYQMELIQDSLTPILRMKATNTQKTQSVSTDFIEFNGSQQLEERVADVLYNKLLPVVQPTVGAQNTLPNHEKSLKSVSMKEPSMDNDEPFDLQIRSLKERLDMLSKSYKEQQKVVDRIASQQSQKNMKKDSQLPITIAKADCLIKELQDLGISTVQIESDMCISENNNLTHESRKQRENMWISVSKRLKMNEFQELFTNPVESVIADYPETDNKNEQSSDDQNIEYSMTYDTDDDTQNNYN